MAVAKAGAKVAKKPAAKKEHPRYLDMISVALQDMKANRSGATRQSILKCIMEKYPAVGKDPKSVNSKLKLALRMGVSKGSLVQTKGTGASGRFKINKEKQKAKERAEKAKKKAAAAKKKATAAKKKTSAKKPKKTTSKAATKASPKKTVKAKKSPAKAKKSPTKKATKKAPAKKVAKRIAPSKKATPKKAAKKASPKKSAGKKK